MSGFVRSNAVRKATVVKSPNTEANSQTNTQTAIPSASLPVNQPVSQIAKPIPGCRTWLHGLTYASTGSVDLDHLCSGGWFVHSLVVCLETDYLIGGLVDRLIDRLLVRLFVADGIAYKHKILTVSAKHPHNGHITAHLPAQSSSKQLPTYQATQPSNQSSGQKASVTLSKSYDLTRKSDQSTYPDLHHIHINQSTDDQQNGQSIYQSTLHQIAAFLHKAEQESQKTGNRNLTRVVVESAGDLDWGYQSSEQARDLLMFVQGLKYLMSRYDAVCLLTFPSSLYQASITQAVLRTCQYGFELRPLPLSSPYREHDALLYVHAMHSGHTLAPFTDHKEWLVAMKRRLTIEKVSLPPELSRDEESQHSNRTAQVNQLTAAATKGQIVVEEEDAGTVKPRAKPSRVGCGSGTGDGKSKFDF